MTCETRDFGQVEYNQNDIISFVQPPFGFDEYKDYIMLIDDEVSNSICWLQSIEDPQLCFILINTSCMYSPEIPSEVNDKISAGPKSIFGICVIKDDFKQSTVNLKSPIIINDENHKAMQVILAGDYKMKHLIFGEGV